MEKAGAIVTSTSSPASEAIPSTDLVLAISPGNSNLQPSNKRGLDNNDPFKFAGLEENSNLSVLDSSCIGIEEDYDDEFFIIKSLTSALATTKKSLDKKRHLKNELSEERSRVTELEARNKELALQLQNHQPTIDQLTLLLQTYDDRATQAEAANSDLLLAQNNLLERYGTLEKQIEEYEAKQSNAGHSVKVAISSDHNDSEHGAAEAARAEHSAKSPIETRVCKTVFEAPPKVHTTDKRKAHTLSSVMEEEEDEEVEEDKQRKKTRLDNKDKEDIINNSEKQNKGKNEQKDGHGELLATNVQPLFVDDDVFQRLGNDCKQLYNLLRVPPHMECIELELDVNIFHHTNAEYIFVMIENIKDLFTMDWLDASIIQVFIMYLYRLCKEFEVSSIGFMCPTQIAKANVDMNLEAVITYLRNTMSKLQDKTFILAPYHQENHWLLLVICASSRMVYVLDPMQHDRDLEIKPVLNMVLRTLMNQRGQRARRVDWKNIKAFQETKAYSNDEIDEIRNMWAKYFRKECV